MDASKWITGLKRALGGAWRWKSDILCGAGEPASQPTRGRADRLARLGRRRSAASPCAPAGKLRAPHAPPRLDETYGTSRRPPAHHDPRAALDGGADGLDFFRRISRQAPPFLKPSGRLMLEFGDDQAQALRQLFAEQNWIVDAVLEDYTHRPRILIARRAPSLRPSGALSDK